VNAAATRVAHSAVRDGLGARHGVAAQWSRGGGVLGGATCGRVWCPVSTPARLGVGGAAARRPADEGGKEGEEGETGAWAPAGRERGGGCCFWAGQATGLSEGERERKQAGAGRGKGRGEKERWASAQGEGRGFFFF